MTEGNKKTSEIQTTIYPPRLIPPLKDAYPPRKSSTLSEIGSINYFQNYRNATLSTFLMPPYEWGMQSTSYSPKPDIVVGKVRRSIDRDLKMLSHGISTIDPMRMKEVDDLFKGVQIHRNQYKDRTGTSHPLVFFTPEAYKYQCAPDMTVSYLTRYPQNYIKYKTPIVLPLTYGRRKQTPYIPDLSLSGIYNKSSCIAYKR